MLQNSLSHTKIKLSLEVDGEHTKSCLKSALNFDSSEVFYAKIYFSEDVHFKFINLSILFNFFLKTNLFERVVTKSI